MEESQNKLFLVFQNGSLRKYEKYLLISRIGRINFQWDTRRNIWKNLNLNSGFFCRIFFNISRFLFWNSSRKSFWDTSKSLFGVFLIGCFQEFLFSFLKQVRLIKKFTSEIPQEAPSEVFPRVRSGKLSEMLHMGFRKKKNRVSLRNTRKKNVEGKPRKDILEDLKRNRRTKFRRHSRLNF